MQHHIIAYILLSLCKKSGKRYVCIQSQLLQKIANFSSCKYDSSYLTLSLIPSFSDWKQNKPNNNQKNASFSDFFNPWSSTKAEWIFEKKNQQQKQQNTFIMLKVIWRKKCHGKEKGNTRIHAETYAFSIDTAAQNETSGKALTVKKWNCELSFEEPRLLEIEAGRKEGKCSHNWDGHRCFRSLWWGTSKKKKGSG